MKWCKIFKLWQAYKIFFGFPKVDYLAIFPVGVFPVSTENVSSTRERQEHPPVLNVWICKKLSGEQVRNCQNNPCFPKPYSKLYILESNQVTGWWKMGSQIPEPTGIAALHGAPRHCACFLLSSPWFSFPGSCCWLQKRQCFVCRSNGSMETVSMPKRRLHLTLLPDQDQNTEHLQDCYCPCIIHIIAD